LNISILIIRSAIKYKNRLDNALKWMKKEGIVPNGWGKVIEKAEKKGRKQR